MSFLSATVAFSQDVRGGIEPAGTTITLRVDRDGFHDAGGIGGGGQVVEPIAVANVATLLRSEFDAEALRAVIGHLAALLEVLDD